MKKILAFLMAVLLCACPGFSYAQFTGGTVLTAAALNAQFALYVPIAGGTLTGPLTVPTLSVSTPIAVTSGGTGANSATGSGSVVLATTPTIFFKRRTITGTTSDTSTNSDATINWNSTTASNKAESLFACSSPTDGLRVIVKDEAGTASTYPIVITPSSGTIEGQSSFSINSNYGSVTLICDASTSNWTVN